MSSKRRRDQDDADVTMASGNSRSEVDISMFRLAPGWAHPVRAYLSFMFVVCCADEEYHLSYSMTVEYRL